MAKHPQIAIAGFGVEGRSSYQYFKSQGDVAIVDESEELVDLPPGAPTILGKGSFGKLQEFDLVIRSAGVAPSKIKTNGKVWSATNEFFAKCPAPIIGVTGTKGKGTTSSLIKSILEAAGRTVHLVGNIGYPALESLGSIQPSDLVVYELSSFQLWDLESSPQVAVILMIEPDHLDVHADFEEYVAVKAHIVAHQSVNDVVVYNEQSQQARDMAEQSMAITKLAYPVDIANVVQGFKLPGQHNLENASAAILAARAVMTISDEVARRGLATFEGLDHRLKLVGQVNGIDYYDDSVATTPGSAIAAIRAFSQSKVLILGGHDKGADLREVIEECARAGVQVVAVGTLSRHIERLCAEQGVKCVVENGSMQAVVQVATGISQPGGVVLLSPAAASFDQYKDYQDRGNQFAVAVRSLAN